MANNDNQAEAPISLPKGGGAIKGIGETFQPNLFSGTGNFSVPIFTSPGRNGFGPKLTLQYSTGNGNGPFGLGWQLSIPRITRKTEKGLPTYRDEDVFVMSGAEDLVPHLEKVTDDPAQWEPVVQHIEDEHTVHLYRPRTEGQFARIERWTHNDGDVHWQATTKENITSIYGRTPAARIIDPQDPDHVFEWLLEETFDARGNHILYEYIHESPDLSLPGIHEQNRGYTQAYIRRILYGNTPDNLDPDLRVGPTRTAIDHTNHLQTRERHYVFEVLFDFGEFDTEDNAFPPGIPHGFAQDPEETIPRQWPVREDPFSSFRAGFEIRSLRRCRRVLMLHHFKEGELDGAPLVKSTDFEYTVNPDTLLSLLSSVTFSGYRKDPDGPEHYLMRDMPPVTFEYSEFKPQEQKYQSVTANGDDLPPQGLNAPDLTLMDVFGNGMTDILQAGDAGFHFWENLGQGHIDRRRAQPGDQPAVSFAQGDVSFGDMAGDGLADLVVDALPVSGFYESAPDGGWRTFKPFETMPSVGLDDPNTRLVDLTGDGLSDVLVTRDEHFLWFRCRGEAGYDEPIAISRRHDLDAFPDVFFADPAGRVRLADMTGDGLNDIVLVHDGRIDYWPNLGYGHFGRRITMANTPRIGVGFDPRRMFLADLDGTGCADLVYVESGKVRFWFNQSGNAWSTQKTINGTPYVTDQTAIQFTDFYSTGTATLLWSYDHAEQPGSNYKLLDFCGGRKPHLIVAMSNNMGATTRVQYAPSTKFYIEDKENDNSWVTNLPFPVHVLEKTEVIDHISKTKLVTKYKYHHGYYDGREREFRGFGRVDQFDTEFFGDFAESSLHGDEASFVNNQSGFYVPPVETRTWFHTGVYFDPDRFIDHEDLTEQFRNEYYQGDNDAFAFEDPLFEQADGIEGFGETPHEAFRALRGAVLRTEVYGLDDSTKFDRPYVVTENRHLVRALQPKNGNHHGVYLTLPKETVTYHYERNPADPRISHNLTLGIDNFGNITDSVAIGYPRRFVPEDLPEQERLQVVYTRTDFINTYSELSSTTPVFYYAGIPCQTRSYEIAGIDWKPGQSHLGERRFEEVRDNSIVVDPDSFLPYDTRTEAEEEDTRRRIIEWTRIYFRKDADPDQIDPIGNLKHRLELGEIESLALPYESYQAAFTTSMLQKIFENRINGIDLAREGGYHPHPNLLSAEGSSDGIQEYHWIPSGRQGFDPTKFLQADHVQDPFGHIASTELDDYALLVEIARDALPPPQTNEISAKNDYRVLQPFEVTDPNDNRSQVAFDALGLVVGTAVMGEDAQGNQLGDTLDGFVADLSEDLRSDQFDDPLNIDDTSDTDGHNILKGATSRLVYDLKRFADSGRPNVVYTLARETHVSEENGTPSKIQHAFVYSDGFGRESQTKVQAEPDPADPTKKPRWVGTGTTIYNNKGKAVQQYEPFFSDDHLEGIERHGYSPAIFYDPLERVVCTVQPNHTYEKVVFDPWQQTIWDSNDTVLLDPRADPDVIEYGEEFFLNYDREYVEEHGESPATWHLEYSSSSETAKAEAARKTEIHADTPTVIHLDTLGRNFLTVAHNKFKRTDTEATDPPSEEFHRNRIVLDIEGNQREVIDAKGRIVMRYNYDMLGTRIYQTSMEAGERWMLNEVSGQPIHAWDSRDHHFRTEYDELRRPTEAFLRKGNETELRIGRIVYGEAQTNPETRKLRGQVFQIFDQAGLVTTDEYDFKGNLLSSRRRLALEYKTRLDWPPDETFENLLEKEIYISRTLYDALNRPTELKAPDSSVVHLGYNAANLLDKVNTNLRGSEETTPFVTNIDYNAKGQRKRIAYGNGTQTIYTYDPETFRHANIKTTGRQGTNGMSIIFNDPTIVQDLSYTYDPTGNITHIADAALKTVFHNGQQIDSVCQYTYDAIYQLIEAKGREHSGQTAFDFNSPNGNFRDYPLVGHRDHPNDLQALRNYTELYEYDEAGNITKMKHSANNTTASWARSYAYGEDSLIEPNKAKSNRLSNTRLTGKTIETRDETYGYNGPAGLHGNITSMPHLPLMEWDYRDQLHATARQVRTDGGTSERTWYIYDAGGQRVRKVTEHQANSGQKPTRKTERIYLGGFEIYREYDIHGEKIEVERETLHIMDDRQRIALVETRTQSNGLTPIQLIRYQISNHLGSAILELDGQAELISYEEYFPYGNTSYQAVHKQNDTLKRYRYTSRERDEESGLCYHGARYYANWLGRWVSTDPMGNVEGTNLYWYGRNSPVLRFDSIGTQSKASYDFVQTVVDEPPRPYNSAYVIITVREDIYTAESPGVSLHITFPTGEIVTVPLIPGTERRLLDTRFRYKYAEIADFLGGDIITVAPPQSEDDGSLMGGVVMFAVELVGPGKVKWLTRAARVLSGEDPTDVATDIGFDRIPGLGKSRITGGKPRARPKATGRRSAGGSGGRSTGGDSSTKGTTSKSASRARPVRRGPTKRLTTSEKDVIRAEAREVAAKHLGKRLPRGANVHHRIPLEFAHMFPEMNPNQIDNLIVIVDRAAMEASSQNFHSRVHEFWSAHLNKIRSQGLQPTREDIKNIASQIDPHILADKDWDVINLR